MNTYIHINNIKAPASMFCKAFLFLGCLFAVTSATAKTLTYRIVEYNTSTSTFILAPSGEKPAGSYAIFENDFGATTGNRYNQIPRNREANLWLIGWKGCCINAVTLSMCSNASSGTAALQVTVGENVVYTERTAEFSSDQWFGRWVSKDLQTYVDITKAIDTPVFLQEKDAEIEIKVKGGTPEGSVYLNSITIDYTTTDGVATESPLGWSFEKLEKKSTLNDGDIVMMYRSGDAAGDIDGMETSHYLDAIGVNSTSSVDDPFITLFTVKQQEGKWTLTDQFNRALGAKGTQNLAWDEGETQWDIQLGYDGATITNKYGTMRYNAPSGTYPRFWNYTSKSLPLPYLYRRTRQQVPVISTELQFPFTQRDIRLGEQDTIVIRHTIMPKTVTDHRISWTSSDESVATVRSGIVEIISQGSVTITAHTLDGGSTATCSINISAPDAITDAKQTGCKRQGYWDLSGRHYDSQPHSFPYINPQGRIITK